MEWPKALEFVFDLFFCACSDMEIIQLSFSALSLFGVWWLEINNIYGIMS